MVDNLEIFADPTSARCQKNRTLDKLRDLHTQLSGEIGRVAKGHDPAEHVAVAGRGRRPFHRTKAI